MRFSIITPTYKRADKLTRAVESLLRQTYTDWEMIIVNDSPKDISYESFISAINDSRIHYHANTTNSGVNYSRNHALDKVTADSDWILFLDDDDYLAPDALATYKNLIQEHSEKKWFVTNRAMSTGKSLTRAPKSDTTYSYAWDYLIRRRFQGDATHCIQTKLLTTLRFSKKIKQGEEWFFFYQLGLKTKFYYHDYNTTITDGYNEISGLNFRKRSTREQLESASILLYEGYNLKLLHHPTFLIYLFMKYIRAFIKR